MDSAFQLFEEISYELQAKRPRPYSFTEASFLKELLDDMKSQFDTSDWRIAVKSALEYVEEHFKKRLVPFPIELDYNLKLAKAINFDALDFILAARSWRENSKQSRAFEELIAKRLSKFLPGHIHRVGFKRTRKNDLKSFTKYLHKEIGFKKSCLKGRAKDGGMDILWQIPIGPKTLRPVVSIQCKNGKYERDDVAASVSKAARTFTRHTTLTRGGVIHLVVINGYVEKSIEEQDGEDFVVTGLPDLLSEANLPASLVIL